MEIRTLTETDAQALWEFRKTALQSEPAAFGESLEEHLQMTVDALSNRLKSGGDENFVLGAVSDASLAGMVGFYRELRLKRRHRGWIWGMYVAPQWRGQHIGRQLMEEAIRRARKISGLQRVLLSVIVSQPGARQLYESIGFTAFGRDPQALHVDGKFLDEDHMGLTLHPGTDAAPDAILTRT